MIVETDDRRGAPARHRGISERLRTSSRSIAPAGNLKESSAARLPGPEKSAAEEGGPHAGDLFRGQLLYRSGVQFADLGAMRGGHELRGHAGLQPPCPLYTYFVFATCRNLCHCSVRVIAVDCGRTLSLMHSVRQKISANLFGLRKYSQRGLPCRSGAVTGAPSSLSDVYRVVRVSGVPRPPVCSTPLQPPELRIRRPALMISEPFDLLPSLTPR